MEDNNLNYYEKAMLNLNWIWKFWKYIVGVQHRSVDRWVLGHIYNMENQFWAGLGSRASTEKKIGAEHKI